MSSDTLYTLPGAVTPAEFSSVAPSPWGAEITVLTKEGDPFSKRIALVDGKPKGYASAPMSKGTAERVVIDRAQDLADLINGFTSNQGYLTSVLRPGIADRVAVVTKDKLNGATSPSTIARSNEYLRFKKDATGILLIDTDMKAAPDTVKQRIKERGGVWGALCDVCPELQNVARVERASTSSGLRNKETGEEYSDSGGRHTATPVCNAADTPRALSILFDLAWLKGYGWSMVSESGAVLPRSIVDLAMRVPTQPVFEAKPILDPQLEQIGRNAIAYDGDIFDTQLCAPLSDADIAEVQKLKLAEEQRLLPERKEKQEKWIAARAETLIAKGMPEAEARKLAEGWLTTRELSGDFPLQFDDQTIAGTTVAEVLAAPDNFIKKTMGDPFEPEYGPGRAKLIRGRRELIIVSLSHGQKKIYKLQSSTVVSVADFHAFIPRHSYIFEPTREIWVSGGVNARIPPIEDGVDKEGKPQYIAATTWLDRNKPVEQMTWAPGEPLLIRDRLIADGGWIERQEVTCFNLYIPPMIKLGDPARAAPWLAHVRKVYPNEADRIIKWCAHRRQKPQEKTNHALLLGGAPGIGKDTLLEPVKRAVGPWNFSEISPQQVVGRFNGFLKSVILRISEAHDLGSDINRYQFYEHIKTMAAAPPDVLRVDEKNLREHAVPNCCGVIITTNHKSDGVFLPPDDRRHYVAWSTLKQEDFTPEYWNKLWRYYDNGGDAHVTAYLDSLDLTGFDPKAPPPKTQAFWDIVDASRAPEDADLADLLDDMGNPKVVTLASLVVRATDRFKCWLDDPRNARAIPHRLENCGYVKVRNPDAKDGLWRIASKRQAIYVKATLSLRDQLAAAQEWGRKCGWQTTDTADATDAADSGAVSDVSDVSGSPPAIFPPPVAAVEGLSRVLGEWKAAFGPGRAVTIDEVIAVEHAGLKSALLAVAAKDDGLAVSNVLLGRWLPYFNGVLINHLFLQHEGINDKGAQLWSLREGDEVPLDELGAPCAGRLSRLRRQKLADWYDHQRFRDSNVDNTQLDNDLREILRKEAPQHVEDEFENIMNIVFAM